MDRDLVGPGTAVEVGAGDGCALRVELARVDVAVRGQSRSHRERSVTAEGADLEDSARLCDRDQELEEPARDGAGEHLPGPERALRLVGQLDEERIVR